MKAVLGFLIIGLGVGATYIVLSGKVSTILTTVTSTVAPVTNAGIANNTASTPSGSGGMSLRSSVEYLKHDRYASRGGMR